MTIATRTIAFSLAALMVLVAGTVGDETKPNSGRGCAASVDHFFVDEVWAKVGAQSCLKCHKTGGDAEDSKFVLQDPQRSQGAARRR